MNQETLKRHLFYNPVTGAWTWIMPTNKRIKKGQAAGSVTHWGYLEIELFGERQKGHRLAWLYMTGAMPPGEVDHKNHDRLDNRWENLRDGGGGVNQQNRIRAQTNSSTGMLGVIAAAPGVYHARITVAKKACHLGSFQTPELAHQAYLQAKREMHEGNML